VGPPQVLPSTVRLQPAVSVSKSLDEPQVPAALQVYTTSERVRLPDAEQAAGYEHALQAPGSLAPQLLPWVFRMHAVVSVSVPGVEPHAPPEQVCVVLERLRLPILEQVAE